VKLRRVDSVSRLESCAFLALFNQQKRGWTSRPCWDRYPSAAAGCTRNWFAGGDSRRATTCRGDQIFAFGRRG